MSKILITGINGVLAKKILKKLSKNKTFELIASTRDLSTLAKIDGVQYISRNDLIATDVLKNVDYVLNCAFPRTQDMDMLQEAKDFFKALVFKSCEMNVKNFVNISTQDIYGNYRANPSCEHEFNPETNYAQIKLECETLLKKIINESSSKMNYTNIRLASLIGLEYPERVINKMINFAKNNKKITVLNDKNVFGYMDISDATDGICNFVLNSNPNEWKNVYNFGVKPDYDNNLLYIAKVVKELFEKNGEAIELDITTKDKAEKLCTMNSQWFYEVSNWQPQLTLRQSIENIFRGKL